MHFKDCLAPAHIDGHTTRRSNRRGAITPVEDIRAFVAAMMMTCVSVSKPSISTTSVQRLLALVVAAAQSARGAADSVDFINENDAG